MALKVFFISPEVIPFANTYFLAQFSKKIAIKFQDNPDIEIRLLHPKYGFISERKYILREVIRLKDFPIQFKDNEKLVSIKSAFIPESRVQIYFLEDETYFKPVPELIYKARNGRVYKDNAEKFALFAKVALETLKQLLWIPDVIVCNDWQSSFIPYLFNEHYKKDVFFKKTRTVFVLHTINDYRKFDVNSYSDLNLKKQKSGKIQDNIQLAIQNADKTICIDYDNSLTKSLNRFKTIKKSLDESKSSIISIQRNPSFSDWKEIVKTFESTLKKK